MQITKDLSSSKFKPMALILLSGTLYGFLGYLGTKLFEENFTLSSMLFWRFFIATIWMTGYCWWKDRSPFPVSEVSQFFVTLVLCSLYYVLGSMLFFAASRTTGTGIAMVVFFSFPLFVALYSFLQNGWRADRVTLLSLISFPVGLVCLMERGGLTPNTLGIGLGMLSAVSYALYILKSKAVLQQMAPRPFTSLVCLGSALIYLIFALVDGELTMPTTLSSMAYLIAIGVFATAIPIQLMLEGLKEVSSLKASMASVCEPGVTLLVGVALLGETITSLQIGGIILILAASVLIQAARD